MSEIVLAVIGVVSGFIGVTVGFFFIKNKLKNEASAMILDLIDELTPELPKILAKDEVRQFIYSLGVLAGNGAKAGALGGISKGGKFRFEDILGGLIQAGANRFLGGGGGEQQPTPATGVSDKW